MRYTLDLAANSNTGWIFNPTNFPFQHWSYQISFADLAGTPATDSIKCYVTMDKAGLQPSLLETYTIPASPSTTDVQCYVHNSVSLGVKFTYTKDGVTGGKCYIDFTIKE